jgi:glycosyltransferase involved in cell wall biosynthesis
VGAEKQLFILGTRGVPASHGGFEAFAEALALYLVGRGWKVTVYCQEEGRAGVRKASWCGVNQVVIPVHLKGAPGSLLFDLKSVWHGLSRQGIFLLLGYNSALFNLLQRLRRQVLLINMDGIEWRRDKWGPLAKAWFWLNERIGCWVGSHLVADHPSIKEHLASRVRKSKITMIPYGADEILEADATLLEPFGLEPDRYSLVVARPEPENSLLEIVSAFSSQRRDHRLVVLGRLEPERNRYHRRVMAAASSEVMFPGAIYEAPVVQALRFFSRLYLHGHRVGGTNPSLVEAMGCGCAVLAHDNPFNRWVAAGGATYFQDEQECSQLLSILLESDAKVRELAEKSRQRFRERFTWDRVLAEYEALLLKWYPEGE